MSKEADIRMPTWAFEIFCDGYYDCFNQAKVYPVISLARALLFDERVRPFRVAELFLWAEEFLKSKCREIPEQEQGILTRLWKTRRWHLERDECHSAALRFVEYAGETKSAREWVYIFAWGKIQEEVAQVKTV